VVRLESLHRQESRLTTDTAEGGKTQRGRAAKAIQKAKGKRQKAKVECRTLKVLADKAKYFAIGKQSAASGVSRRHVVVSQSAC
jgi:hypothetical protein